MLDPFCPEDSSTKLTMHYYSSTEVNAELHNEQIHSVSKSDFLGNNAVIDLCGHGHLLFVVH